MCEARKPAGLGSGVPRVLQFECAVHFPEGEVFADRSRAGTSRPEKGGNRSWACGPRQNLRRFCQYVHAFVDAGPCGPQYASTQRWQRCVCCCPPTSDVSAPPSGVSNLLQKPAALRITGRSFKHCGPFCGGGMIRRENESKEMVDRRRRPHR